MNTFINLSHKQSKGIDKVIYKNARQLKKDALIIATNNKSYSSATSLLILSLEEVIKAILVLLHSEEYKVYKINDARKFFFDHKIRHQLAQLIEITVGFVESLDKWEKQEPTNLIKTKSEGLNSLLNGIFDIAKAITPLANSEKRIDKLEDFNSKKNNDLYVGYQDKLIVPQEEINENVYIETKDIVERIFRVYKILRILYHPCIHNRKDSKEIESIKNQMKIFIDERMKGFLFINSNFR